MSDLNQDRIALDVLDATDKAYDRGFEAGYADGFAACREKIQTEREKIESAAERWRKDDDLPRSAKVAFEQKVQLRTQVLDSLLSALDTEQDER